MKLPNKLFSYKESVISKFSIILQELSDKKDISIFTLYRDTKKNFENISEFLETLDCLYALGKLDYDSQLGRINNVI